MYAQISREVVQYVVTRSGPHRLNRLNTHRMSLNNDSVSSASGPARDINRAFGTYSGQHMLRVIGTY